ncbi:MAG TPA: M23 family metallopeptidase [Pseudidiomarina sp.]|nr:M23 family metallopeptidase [Pseudidiomarina sp.]
MRKGLVLLSLILSIQSTWAQDIELRGAAAPGGLMIGKVDVNTEVIFKDQSLPKTPQGYVVFGFGRDDTGVHRLILRSKDGQERVQEIELAAREYDIDRVEGVPQETVTPDPQQVQRAREEAERVWLARNQTSTRTDFLTPLQMPAEGRISGVYGSQRIFNGTPRNPHYGLDIAAPTGSPVTAPWSGQVIFADADLFYSGGTLILDHGYGVTSTYIHLHKLHVEVGDIVQQGEFIAEIGATGRVTGPHLDWRLNWGQERLDPALALEHFKESATSF